MHSHAQNQKVFLLRTLSREEVPEVLYLASRTSTVMNSPKPYHMNTGKVFFDRRLCITFCLVTFFAQHHQDQAVIPCISHPWGSTTKLQADGRFPPNQCWKSCSAPSSSLQIPVSCSKLQ